MFNVMSRDFGNPSSGHRWGIAARNVLEESRKIIARCINAEPDEIYFTSGGTESDNWAMMIGVCSAIDRHSYRRSESAYSSIEHHAVLNACVHYTIPANEDGIIEPRDVEDLCHNNTDIGFVSVMLANNEIGTIQPIKEIAEVLYHKGIFLHTDAVQAVGHIPIDVKNLCVDMLSASAHKFNGPKGVGFLYLKKGMTVQPMILGGGQERGMRSGTENVAGIYGMAIALKESVYNMEKDMARVYAMRDRLIDGLMAIPGAKYNGCRDHCLPGIVNVSFPGIDGGTLAILLDARGIAVSTGSACTTGDLAPSHVLKAIGCTDEEAKGAIRISLDHYNTDEEIDYILKTIPECVAGLRKMKS
jgi:cysteine desulfurase